MILFLSSIGIWEILLVLLVVLMLFGANSIPPIARSLGKGIRQIKDVSSDLQREINSSAHSIKEDLKKEIGEDPFKEESKKAPQKKIPEKPESKSPQAKEEE